MANARFLLGSRNVRGQTNLRPDKPELELANGGIDAGEFRQNLDRRYANWVNFSINSVAVPTRVNAASSSWAWWAEVVVLVVVLGGDYPAVVAATCWSVWRF